MRNDSPVRRGRLAVALLSISAALALGAGARADTAADRAKDDVAIRQRRMGTLVVQAAPGATVRVEQVRHAFWFGAALSSGAFSEGMPAADVARYRETFLANFNSAVTENALKWPSMEPRRGEVNYQVVDAILAWTDAHQLPLRGHNVFWGIEKFLPPWLKALDAPELRGVLEQRARTVARRYRGRFAEYDLNNEMIHGNYFAERLGPRITLEMAQWMKAEDPAAALFLNDYDITTGRKLPEYVAQIRELRAMGVPLAGIGVQGHLHGETFDRAALRHSLDELAQFGLPVRVTEFNLPGQRSKFYEHPELAITPAEEARSAAEITDFLRICFAHPAVEGILLWGFWEGANWIPQSSLYRRDWTPTPAGLAYRDLVFREWWTRWEGRADQSGRCEVPAYLGTHRVSTGARATIVELSRPQASVTVDLR